MPNLHVSVRLHGVVVEQRLCPVDDELWLGDHERAAVAFPGASFRVRRFGDRLRVQGVWLEPGRPVRMRRGPVEIRVEAVVPRPMPRPLEWLPDFRLLVATLAVVLFGASWEAAHAFVRDNPTALAAVFGASPTEVAAVDSEDQTPDVSTAGAGDRPDASVEAPAVAPSADVHPIVGWRAD